MIHAFRLGPLSPGPPPSFAYAAALPSGRLEIQLAPADVAGLKALREALGEHPITCEPALAEAAATLGLEVAPLTAEALQARAQLAYELASGIDHGASRPEAIAALLTAAGAYWSSKAWELIPPEEELHVAFAVGRALVQGELSVQAADRAQPRLVLCDDAAALERLRGLKAEERVAALVKAGGLTVEFTREPAWAGSAIQEAVGLPRVPMPERRRGGRVAPIATQDLVLAAVLMKGVVAFTDLGDDSEVEAELEAASFRVKVRVGPTPVDPSSLGESGLTRVQSDDDARAATPARETEPLAEPAAAPAAMAASAPEPEPEEGDAPLSPAELAAMLKGESAPPPAGEDDEAPLSPEELAALLKGDAASPPREPSPVAEPTQAPTAPEPTPAVEIPEPSPMIEAPRRAPPPAPPEVVLTPARPAAPPPPPPPPEPAPAVQAAPAPTADRRDTGEGWIARAFRAIGSTLHREREPAREKPKAPATRPKLAPRTAPKGAPPARRAPPPPAPEGPLDPAVPFAPFARALRVAVPAEPPAVPLAEHEATESLAKQLVSAAAGREHFVSFPAVAVQVIELVRAPDADARGVAGFISRDPGLAADVLAVANSAAFRGVTEAASVREAVARLGLQEVGRVAGAVTARALLAPAQGSGPASSTALFKRAVAVATAASATALRLRGAHSDQVWLAGLLHDVGLALGASALPALAGEGGPAIPGPQAERVVERAHAEIGAAALRAWGLPQYLADVCARHHGEALAEGPELVDLHLVRLTSALSRLAEPEAGARAAREIVSSARVLGFDANAVRALAADLKAAEQRATALVR